MRSTTASTITWPARLHSPTAGCVRCRLMSAATSGCNEPRVELFVERALARPGEITAHAVGAQPRAVRRLRKQIERGVQRPCQRLVVEVIEHHPGSQAGVGVVVLD